MFVESHYKEKLYKCTVPIVEGKVIHTFQELSTSGNIFVSCCPPPKFEREDDET